jgi:hypothetical protein
MIQRPTPPLSPLSLAATRRKLSNTSLTRERACLVAAHGCPALPRSRRRARSERNISTGWTISNVVSPVELQLRRCPSSTKIGLGAAPMCAFTRRRRNTQRCLSGSKPPTLPIGNSTPKDVFGCRTARYQHCLEPRCDRHVVDCAPAVGGTPTRGDNREGAGGATGGIWGFRFRPPRYRNRPVSCFVFPQNWPSLFGLGCTEGDLNSLRDFPSDE